MELTVIALTGETPKQHMSRLGELSKKVTAGRIKALTSGLDAIRMSLWEVSNQIESEQKRLLAAHPELIMMAFE